MKVDILVFGAHPDDIELGCAGTILKSVSEGKTVGAIDLTQGELGTRGTAEIRRNEAEDASKLMQLSFRKNLGFPDGFITNEKSNQLDIIAQLRTHRPEVVLCNAIKDRHIDHAKASQLVSEACFLSGLKKVKTLDKSGSAQEAWRPKRVYHYIQWEEITPDFVVDISGFLDEKIKVVSAYKSQFFDPNSAAPTTPISSKNFLNSVRYRAENLGRLTGVDAGEGFTVERFPLVKSLSDLA